MGMEETHVCPEKESDRLTVCSNGDLSSSSDEHVDSFDQLSGTTDTERLMLEDNSDSNDCEVKECTVQNIEPAVVECVVESRKEEQITFIKDVGNDLKIKPAVKHERVPPKGKIKCKESPVEHTSKNFTKNIRSSCTVPQPFTLATEKRASAGAGAMNHEIKFKSSPTKDSKLRKIISTFVSRKSMRAEYKKNLEEDSSSVTSTVVSVTPKKKMLASSPKFRCSERAEKRKEFNSKLEEKQLALEAEKVQYEARAKEEAEAAIKHLRKSLTFKATPLPGFYLNGPLPNTELRKFPATLPKSPKLGRRKSCSDAQTSFQEAKIKEACVQEHRASLGNYKGKTFESNGCYKKRGQATSKFKVEQIVV